ncbi:Bacterial alpha-L-rhamnosidase [Marinihelvus fidelis]|uniref:alpha-L-rhamnosidase n=1 Tax=Marinihelvus fidelis TaxID=2613842 RepID=A0A5N0T8E9_9GAMM|nr:alpha-L-rhamnosidase [Marinihelvus fidelis]KAA9131031.1 Bacterial alpha-L-rhamnosidase [Marinihelvus fidelis]
MGSSTEKNSTSLAVTDLRADGLVTPLGLESRAPHLSWRIESGTADTRQSAYRIRVAESPEALADVESLIADSGWVESDATLNLACPGPALPSMTRAWWDVEIREADGKSTRSPATWFETGLDQDDWIADWLEAEDPDASADRAAGLEWIWSEDPLDPNPQGFRLDFEAPADLATSDLLVTAKDHLEGVWVNGEPVDLPEGDVWGTLRALDAVFRPGRNSLCILASADTEGFFPVDGGAMAALVRLSSQDGTTQRLVSNGDWRVLPDPLDRWHDDEFDGSDWPAAVASGSRATGDPRPPEPAVRLRTEFDTEQPVARARLYVTALGAYEARLNGRVAGDAVLQPEISVAEDHVPYRCIDLTDQVRLGRNTLAFTVADGFYASAFGWRMERYSLGPAPRRLLAQLRLDFADGSHRWVCSSDDWLTGPSPVITADIYGGERYDAQLDQPGWDQPDFDADGWRPATVGAPPGARLAGHAGPPLVRRAERKALEVTEPAPGRFVFDFGQNLSGWCRLRARGPAGTTVHLRFAELLNPDGTADQSNLRYAESADHYTLAGDAGGETYEPAFTYHGFRYVEVEGFPGTPTAEDLVAMVVYNDCPETGEMVFDNALLQAFWNNALWSQRANFFGVPTDCPQRDERMGWMGDIQVFLDAAAFNMDVAPFLRRYMDEVRAGQFDDGGFPIVVPQPQSFPEVVTAGWSEAGVILPHGLWWRYGDTAVIDENWDAMRRWMDYVARNNPDGIWRHDRGIDLGDWLAVDARVPDEETTPRVLCATAYWALCAGMMAEMAEVTGRAAEAEQYSALQTRIQAAAAAELVDDAGVAGNGSQASQVLALHCALVPAALRAAAAQVLADEIHGRGMHLSTGFLGTPYLLDVLADAGHWDTVEGLLLQTGYPSWGYMVEKGATTMWERWNSDVGDLAMNSYNHYAFGAVVGFFYRRLGGIAPASPGFRDIAIRPAWLDGVGTVSARYDSVVGRIATRVDGDHQGLRELDLETPANTTAHIELPAGFDWQESGQPLRSAAGLQVHEVEGGLLRITAGAGRYRFER